MSALANLGAETERLRAALAAAEAQRDAAADVVRVMGDSGADVFAVLEDVTVRAARRSVACCTGSLGPHAQRTAILLRSPRISIRSTLPV